jgi:O-antigen/teichoic acid export membrane protein
MKRDALFTRFLQGVSWNTAASILSQGSVLIGTVIMARLLGAESFGIFSMVQSTALVLVTMISGGMNVTTSKLTSELAGRKDWARLGSTAALCLMTALVLSFLFATALWFSSGSMASMLYITSSNAAMLLKLSSIYVFFWSIWWCQTGILSGLEAFSRLTAIQLVQAVLSLLLVTVMTWLYQLPGATAAWVLSAVTSVALHQWAIHRELRARNTALSIRGGWKERRVLLTSALPASLSGMIPSIALWLNNAILVRQAGGLEQMAMFQAANVLRNLILFVPLLLTRVTSAMLSNLLGGGDQAGYHRIARLHTAVSFGAALVVALVVAVGSPYLFQLFGSEFEGAQQVLLILSASAILETLASSFYQPIFALGRMWSNVIVVTGWSLVLVMVFVFYTKTGGAEGLAYAYGCAWLFSSAAYFAVSSQLTRQLRKEGVPHDKPSAP